MFMLRQGHSAPGLDIMLLKQQFLRVSGQAANPARQHPPVEYVYRSSHPMLQFLPQKLAEWIANNYAEELNVYSWVMRACCYKFNMERHLIRGRNVKVCTYTWYM